MRWSLATATPSFRFETSGLFLFLAFLYAGVSQHVPEFFRLCRLCRYPAAVATRSFKRIDSEIRAEQLPLLDQGLVQRAAFRDIFDFAATLEELTEEKTSGLDQARANAFVVAQAVVNALKEIQQEVAA
jgi:hypothetical protein